MKVAVAIDGSECSRRAFDRALSLVKPNDTLCLLTVADIVSMLFGNSGGSGVTDSISETKKSMEDQVTRTLAKFKSDADAKLANQKASNTPNPTPVIHPAPAF